MTKPKKALFGVIGAIVVVGFVLGVFGFMKGLQNSQDNNLPSDEIASAFQKELIDRALARGPRPIEGFEAFMLLGTFPGLEEIDFDGVQTGIMQEEGVYSYTNGELQWSRTKYQSITSGEKTVSKEGYKMLLRNLSQRLDVPASSAEEVIIIIDEIDIPADIAEHIASKRDFIRVYAPWPFSVITSPLAVRGEARGFWFFEADFPIKLYDDNGELLTIAVARAQSDPEGSRQGGTYGADWMTEEFVPFEAELKFEVPETEKGTLVLEKDNPSGLPENADELRIAVIFAKETREMDLYYYNPESDKDESGNIMCSRDGLAAVKRKAAVTKTPIQDAIRLLLSGELTEEERTQGIDTEYPLEGLSLKGASLKDGVLTLEFDDPNNKTVGGACRVGILWFQIEATAKQFPEVRQIRFLPEEIFQP